jgi:hypothetical protein
MVDFRKEMNVPRDFLQRNSRQTVLFLLSVFNFADPDTRAASLRLTVLAYDSLLIPEHGGASVHSSRTRLSRHAWQELLHVF